MHASLKFVGLSAASVLLTLGGYGTVQADEEVNIFFNSFFPPQHFLTSSAIREWASDVEEVTEGRVTVTIPPRTAAPPQDLWMAVQRGLIDGAYIFNGWADNQITLPLVGQLPWLSSDSSEANSVALWRTYEEYFADTGEYEDVQLIGLFMAPGAELYSMMDTPILALEDLTERKTWALAGTTADLLRAIDAPIVTGPAVQMHEPISIGVVEGFAGVPLIDADAFKAMSYARSVTVLPTKVTAPSFSMFINKDTWERIAERDRRAIEAVSGEALAQAIGRAWDEQQAQARQRALDNGVEFVEAPSAFYEALQAAGDPLVQEWIDEATAKGVDAQAAITFYTQQVSSVMNGDDNG
ncbi:TRAP transporter substrate-binding protein DctP [Halomonas sp. H5]|uniref:TRAP transporter substrate-binding protein DctP n=1 Tax=Halomonas sp. H5 TaxID=3423910 RepID=UPI003D361E27